MARDVICEPDICCFGMSIGAVGVYIQLESVCFMRERIEGSCPIACHGQRNGDEELYRRCLAP